MAKRLPFAFHKAYCEGHQGTYGWVADGRSPRAETELTRRMSLIMIKRPRSVIWANTPPKIRQVIRLDVGAKDESDKLARLIPDEKTLFGKLEALLETTKDAIAEKVIEGLAVGEKTVVWCLTRKSVEMMTTELEEATEARDVRTLMRQHQLRIWATHGDADIKARNTLAADFRAHPGAGVIVATIDSMPEAISLLGAETEHFAQMHFLPGPMFQAENRPYHKDIRGLTIFYYVPKNSIAERIEALVLPRIETMDKLSGETDASEALVAFAKKQETLAEQWARLFANMPEDGSATFGSDDMGEDDD